MKHFAKTGLLLFFLAILACSKPEQQATNESVSVAQLLAKGAIALDVRTEAEFQSGHYPGALNIPVDQIEQRLNELPDKSIPIVTYCAAGVRAERAAGILQAAGYSQVVNGGGLRDLPRR